MFSAVTGGDVEALIGTKLKRHKKTLKKKKKQTFFVYFL